MTDWNEFTKVIDQVRAAIHSLELRPYQDAFYRGHRCASYTLLPSLFRQGDRTYAAYFKMERRMFFEFRTRARQLYTNDYTGWDVLFHMQHHGVPTRLLDWSSTFGVALYFALLSYDALDGRDPCVWILNPYALNHSTWNLYRLFEPKYLARDEAANRSYDYSEILLETAQLWQTPLAIYSHQRSERMFAQGGFFTIHGRDHRPLEEIVDGRPGILSKVDLPRAAIPAAREFLSFAGIGHRQLFPDLDGVARSVCEKFDIFR